MRRLDFLINEVRESTDNADTNGISNNELVQYFNDAQRTIAGIIFKNNPDADMFKTQVEYPATSTGIYTLPEDCYSINSISLVEGKYNTTTVNEGYSRIRPISELEASYMFGYYARNNTIILSGQNDIAQVQMVRITYFRNLKTLDVRRGTVGAVVPNTSFAVTGLDTTVFTKDDHFCTVNALGEQIVSDIYSAAVNSPITTTDTTGIASGQFLVSGKDTQNVSELPDSCEPYLLDYVRQRIYGRNNYDDANKQMYFTEKQEAQIISIFSKNKKDTDSIPVTDTAYLNF